MKKLRVAVLFGGRSGEHEVSLLSASSILRMIDRSRYDVVPLGITREGRWLTTAASERLLHGDTSLAISAGAELAVSPERQMAELGIDVMFPVLHGTFGEDGTIQGLLELANVAYVGSGVLGSATGMDKAVMKQLFAAAGLPQTPHVTLLRSQWRREPAEATAMMERALRYPLFVKPANSGSSVGISKVRERRELQGAMDLAASYDRKLVIEEGVGGPGGKARELEVAVMGNDEPESSVVGEIVPAAEFYDYKAKYESADSVAIVPAVLAPEEAARVRAMSLAAFRACDCAGLARVDFLMEPAAGGAPARIYLNEINTMPGFTSISMYPKLWEASGVPYGELIDRLIAFGLDRFAEREQTRFSVDT